MQMFSWCRKVLRRRLSGGKTRNLQEKLSTEARDAKNALQQVECELREARADLGRAFSDIEDREAEVAETRRLLWTARKERARLAGGTICDKFWIIKQKAEEENSQLKEQLARAESATLRLMFDHEAELKAEREQRQHLEAQLAALQAGQQKPKTKSWRRRLGW